MDITVDAIVDRIPLYLTKPKQEGFVKALNDFPRINYFVGSHPEKLLQGDCWNRLQLLNFHTAERRWVRGLVLSNTCDIALENARLKAPSLLFAPIISMRAWGAAMIKHGIEERRIEATLASMRQQHVTSVFYVPASQWLEEEHIVFLDDVYSMPVESLLEDSNASRIVSLSQIGFYLFLMKLSIHFCRFHENVDRDAEPLPI